MSMRRNMRAAAAASILFLAAGTSPAHASNPFGEGFAEGIRWIGLIANVTVDVTEISMVDSETSKARIKWTLSNEDSSLADDRNGYCMRVKFPNEDWQEKCFSEAPSSATTFPVATTYYWGDMTLEFPSGAGVEAEGYLVDVQARMEYGTGGWTSWSDSHSEIVKY